MNTLGSHIENISPENYLYWKNKFISHTFPSWKFDETLEDFQPPIAYPQDGKMYAWNEELLQWKEITND